MKQKRKPAFNPQGRIKGIQAKKLIYRAMAKALPKTFRAFPLSPKGRIQVGVTPKVREYAGSFMAKGLFGLEFAKAIAEDIASFKKVRLPAAKAQEKWASRSAEEIIASRAIIAQKGEPMICGCTDIAQATVAAMRAAGIPVVILREHLHTSAKIALREKGQWVFYYVDPSLEKGNRVKIRELKDEKSEKKGVRKGHFAEGPSLAQIGIKSNADFARYQYRGFRQKNP